MKKYRFLSALLTVVLLLLLLTACQTVPATQSDPAGSTPSSSSITPPSSSIIPPMSSVPETTPPSLFGSDGIAFVYNGEQPFLSMTLDLSNCISGHLYWVDEGSTAVIPIVEEKIAPCYNEYWERNHGHVYVNKDGVIYYVKASEPTKVYRTCREDFSKHEVFYESSQGPVVDLFIEDSLENYLQFVADNKKFIVLNMNTMEETVLMEMFYIFSAYVGPGKDTELDDAVFWRGKPTEEDRHLTYGYSRVTGEIWEEPT